MAGPLEQGIALCSASIVPFSPPFNPLPGAGLKWRRAGGTLLHAQELVAPFPDEEAEAQDPTALVRAGLPARKPCCADRCPACPSQPWFGAVQPSWGGGEQVASSHHNPEPLHTGTSSLRSTGTPGAHLWWGGAKGLGPTVPSAPEDRGGSQGAGLPHLAGPRHPKPWPPLPGAALGTLACGP